MARGVNTYIAASSILHVLTLSLLIYGFQSRTQMPGEVAETVTRHGRRLQQVRACPCRYTEVMGCRRDAARRTPPGCRSLCRARLAHGPQHVPALPSSPTLS